MSDYERIAKIIRYLDEHHLEQPCLEKLAAHAGLSLHHFHRLFSKWAGITPKDFLQCLTFAHAKRLLQEGENVLDTALGSGLSGPGRLHDLCVTLQAASPGEIKSGGKGWIIVAGYAETPFGRSLIAESPRGICHLSFTNENEAAWDTLKQSWPFAHLRHDNANALRISRSIFETSQFSKAPLKAYVKGTFFQVRVWQALLATRSGTITTYGRLAEAIGRPKAARAVGSAVGQNPIALLIPCHRVIRETGVFGNYRWDPIRKKAMLAWESAKMGCAKPENAEDNLWRESLAS